MATKNFRSTVLEPTSEFAHGDKLRFTALATVGEVLKGSFSETTIGEDGVYSVDLQYGKHRIDYKPYEGVWRHFADVEVNADTLATTLQDLALASVPVTDETILVLQGILADAEAAKTESAAIRDEAAASAAAAAEDAAKLADIDPLTIGAVSNEILPIVLSPAGASHYTTQQFIKIATPKVGRNEYLRFRISILTVTNRGFSVHHWTDIDISAVRYNSYDKWDATAALQTMSNDKITIRMCVESGGDDDFYISLEREGGWIESTVIVRGMMTELADAGWSEGWAVTSSDEAPPLADISQTVTTNEGVVSIGSDAVKVLTHDGLEYRGVTAYGAKRNGIPDHVFNAALAEQQASELFKTEKNIALQIMSDFNLGTGEQEITGADIADVRAYIQSIDPAKGLKAGHLQRAKIPRPSIFDRYS